MKQVKSGLRSVQLFFFAFLFLSALSLSVYFTLPLRMTHTAHAVAEELPLSLPELRVTAYEPFSEADQTELSLHGTPVLYTCALLSTKRSVHATGDGTLLDTSDVALYTLPTEYGTAFYTLSDGRAPQNAGECVIASERGTYYEIGDTLVLWAGEEPLYRLTVVGVAEDADSRLCAFADGNDRTTIPSVHIYRPEEGNERVDDALRMRYMAALLHTEDAAAAKEALQLYTNVKYDGKVTDGSVDTAALDAAQAEANDAEIKQLRIANQIASLDVAAKEAEDAYLLASAALEAERQDFHSSMERHEAVRANQVHLITRREAAEEAYAKKEAELAALYAEIAEIYTERDILKQSLTVATATVREAEATLELLKTGGEAKPTVTSPWYISAPRDTKYGDTAYVRLASGGAALASGFLITGILCVGFMAASVLFFRGKLGVDMSLGMGNVTLDTLMLVAYALLTAVLGAAIGGFLLPQWKFAREFATFHGVLAQPNAIFPVLLILVVLLAALFLLLNVCGAYLFSRNGASVRAEIVFSDDE